MILIYIYILCAYSVLMSFCWRIVKIRILFQILIVTGDRKLAIFDFRVNKLGLQGYLEWGSLRPFSYHLQRWLIEAFTKCDAMWCIVVLKYVERQMLIIINVCLHYHLIRISKPLKLKKTLSTLAISTVKEYSQKKNLCIPLDKEWKPLNLTNI